MHPDAEPGDGAVFGVPPEQIIPELLELCEEFLRQAIPLVHAELSQFPSDHGHVGRSGWFLDVLGFTSVDRTARDHGDPRLE